MGNKKKEAPYTLESIRGLNDLDNHKFNKNLYTLDKLDLESEFSRLTEKNANPFPVEIFPKVLQEVLYEAYNKYQFSKDYLGAGFLSAISASIGVSYKVEVKKGWLVKCNLFMVIVGRPGDAKSHALDFCFKPLHKRENELFHKYEKEIIEYENILESDQKKINQPFLKRFLINDSTPEALIKAHSKNKRGLYVYRDELVGWIKNFNRYNNSDEEQVYLTFWSGGVITVDRVTSKSTRLEDPFIGVIGSTQISVLKEFAKDGRSSNGFMDRLLFVFPEIFKTIKWNTNKVHESIFQHYFTIITNLIDLKFDENNKSNIIPIEEQAKKYLFNWQNSRPDNYLFEYERSIEIKLQDYVIRFALILQLVYHASEKVTERKIELFAIKGGIKLFDYFYCTAIKVREQTINRNYYENLSDLQKAIINDLPSNKSFTTADGVKIACRNENGKPRVSERQFKTYLKDRKLFKKVAHGIYEKLL